MLKGIQVRSESYRNWCDQVEKVLDGVGNDKTGTELDTLMLECVKTKDVLILYFHSPCVSNCVLFTLSLIVSPTQ